MKRKDRSPLRDPDRPEQQNEARIETFRGGLTGSSHVLYGNM
jgi:hypothetical protein